MIEAATKLDLDDILSLIAARIKVNRNMISPYQDFTNFLTELFKYSDTIRNKIIACGQVLPEIAIAADRADMELEEIFGKTPFSSDISNIIDAIQSPKDIVYIANPNRLTGANFSLAELENIHNAIPEGNLIIDEYYYDFFGITGRMLLDKFDNVIVLRSFTATFGLNSFEAGYAVSSSRTISRLKELIPQKPFSTILRKSIMTIILNDQATKMRLDEIHEESLRLATQLNRIGVRSRIVAGDYLLIKVKDTARVGNHIARHKIAIENLDGYPLMKNYMRYQIQSVLTNDKLIEAFQKMPSEYYQLTAKNILKTTIRRPSEEKQDTHSRITATIKQE